MICKTIQYKELEKAVSIAFTDDKLIFDLYDPTVKVETLSELVADILRKIKEYEGSTYCGIYDRAELIGYFVYKAKMLISFALAVEYRVRVYLRKFFQLIRKEIKGHFACVLWTKNVRGIRWLLKNKMEVFNQTEKIIQLVI